MIVLTSTICDISEMEKIDQYVSDIAQNGGHSALEKLYLCIKDYVFGYALSILKNTHDAEDVLQDCCIAIYQSAHLYRSNGKPMAWIFTITRNLCLEILRGRSRISDLPEEDWEPYLKSNEHISPEDRLVLEHCVQDLQDDEREILLLHIFSGLKHREIAGLTGRPLSTVLSKYHRALKKMRVIMKEGGRTDG